MREIKKKIKNETKGKNKKLSARRWNDDERRDIVVYANTPSRRVGKKSKRKENDWIGTENDDKKETRKMAPMLFF